MTWTEHYPAIEDIVELLKTAPVEVDAKEQMYQWLCTIYSDPLFGEGDGEVLTPQKHLDVLVEMFACAVLMLVDSQCERAWSLGSGHG